MSRTLLSNLGPVVDWEIGAATTWAPDPFVWKDENDAAIDVTGYSARLKIREKHGGALLLDADSYVTVGTTDGKFTVNIPDSVVAVQTWRSGVYVLEVEPPSGAPVTQLLRGTVQIVPGDSAD